MARENPGFEFLLKEDLVDGAISVILSEVEGIKVGSRLRLGSTPKVDVDVASIVDKEVTFTTPVSLLQGSIPEGEPAFIIDPRDFFRLDRKQLSRVGREDEIFPKHRTVIYLRACRPDDRDLLYDEGLAFEEGKEVLAEIVDSPRKERIREWGLSVPHQTIMQINRADARSASISGFTPDDRFIVDGQEHIIFYIRPEQIRADGNYESWWFWIEPLVWGEVSSKVKNG